MAVLNGPAKADAGPYAFEHVLDKFWITSATGPHARPTRLVVDGKPCFYSSESEVERVVLLMNTAYREALVLGSHQSKRVADLAPPVAA